MIKEFLNDILVRAIDEVKSQDVRIYTFALYHDHESGTVSVCADTKDDSMKCVRDTNTYNMKYFAEHLFEGEYDDLSLWQANVGRSLSLGDFTMVNVARTDVPGGIKTDTSFYLSMVKSVIDVQQAILELAENKDEILFCCSGPDSEVALVWSEIKST